MKHDPIVYIWKNWIKLYKIFIEMIIYSKIFIIDFWSKMSVVFSSQAIRLIHQSNKKIQQQNNQDSFEQRNNCEKSDSVAAHILNQWTRSELFDEWFCAENHWCRWSNCKNRSQRCNTHHAFDFIIQFFTWWSILHNWLMVIQSLMFFPLMFTIFVAQKRIRMINCNRNTHKWQSCSKDGASH